MQGTQNPSDALTKYLSSERLEKHIKAMNATFEDGRAQSAPIVGALEIDQDRAAQKSEGEYVGARMNRWLRLNAWADVELDNDVSSAELWESQSRTRIGKKSVRFDGVVTRHYVPAYSAIFGRHPSTFHVDSNGTMITSRSDCVHPEASVAARHESGRLQRGSHGHTLDEAYENTKARCGDLFRLPLRCVVREEGWQENDGEGKFHRVSGGRDAD